MTEKGSLFEGRYQRLRSSGASGWYGSSSFAELLDFARPHMPAPGAALELGCGAGENCLELARRGWTVAGVDISETAAAWARERLEAEGFAGRFCCHDLSLPLPESMAGEWKDAFDLVVDGDCLHFLAGEAREGFWKAVRHALKPGGLFLLRTNVGAPPREEWDVVGYDPEARVTRMNGTAMNLLLEPDEVLKELREAGLQAAGLHLQPGLPGLQSQALWAAARPV